MTAATGRLVWHNTIVNSSNVHDLYVVMIDRRGIWTECNMCKTAAGLTFRVVIPLKSPGCSPRVRDAA
jgi:hypothetical protein